MRYKQYCKEPEKIENYEKAKKDNFKGWNCHHRLQTWNSDGKRRDVDITASELKALGMYYNRPASELIFLTESEHSSLHKKGKKFSEEHKKKLSDSWDYDKHFTEETRRKMREAHKRKQPMLGKHHSEETRRKMREAHKGNTNTKGHHWYNNGKINIMAKECPEGFTPGRLR